MIFNSRMIGENYCFPEESLHPESGRIEANNKACYETTVAARVPSKSETTL
jgi:hypothetical protein